MSNYENYSQVSINYDQTRIPAGVEIITGCLAQNPVPMAQQHLLDAGCGTGNYSQALLSQVGQITAVDLNPGMLDKARKKVARAMTSGRISFYQAAIHSLPFEDKTFDGIMINQVLHHLERSANADYSAYRAVFTEFARVLKPGGALVINTCSHQQLNHGFWYYKLIPDETRRMRERHASIDILKRLMDDAGIGYQARFVPVDTLMQGDDYFNARGPLSKNWRDGDSIWSTVSKKKLSEISARLTRLEQSGTLNDYMQECDARRKHLGQLSFLFGRRVGEV